jgi:opacity protein-like surface antigen
MRACFLIMCCAFSSLATAAEFVDLDEQLSARVFQSESLFELDDEVKGAEPRVHDEYLLSRGLGDFTVGFAPGLMFSPFGFAASFDMQFWVLPQLSFGPQVQIGVNDDTFFLGVAPTVKGTLVLKGIERFQPYASLGVGLAFVSRDRGSVDRDFDNNEVGLLIAFGLGVDYHLWRHFSLGSGLIFDFIATEAAGERFIVVLEIVRVRFHF